MQEKDVPQHWIDAALNGVTGDADDARLYLAQAYEAIKADFLWDMLESSPSVTCSCGMGWEVLVEQGPDFGHGRYDCPSSGDATVQINGYQMKIHKWRWTPIEPFGVRRLQLSGWIRGEFDRERDIYNGARLEYVELPGRQNCPIGQLVDVSVKGYGNSLGLFLRVKWDR
jgi:hypothetical protein